MSRQTKRIAAAAMYAIALASVVRGQSLPVVAPGSAPPMPPVRSADGVDRIEQFRKELEALRKARSELGSLAPSTGGDSQLDERMKLKSRMLELIEQLKAREAAIPPPRIAAPATGDKSTEAPSDNLRPIDRLRLVQNLFRSGENQAAYRALLLIEPAGLNAKELLLARYMLASCHRRMGRLDKAKEIYKEVAASKDDSFLAECAAWQFRSLEIREGLANSIDTTPIKNNSK